MKKSLFLLFLVLTASGAFCANAELNSAYSYDYTQPPEFQPSLKSRFAALSSGVTDVLANPAGILHVNTIEVAIGVSEFVKNPVESDVNRVYVDDKSLEGIVGSPNSRAYLSLSDTRGIITPETRPVVITEDYSKGGGINYFGTTYRVADWLAVSISRKRPTAIAINYQLLAPVAMIAKADFRGTSVEVGGGDDYIYVREDGKLEVVQSGSIVATSEQPLWSSFLNQGTSEVNWVDATFDNSITNRNSVVITAAVKTGQVSWGMNVIPETIDIELNNEMYVQSDAGNGNLTFYLPQFDFGSTEAAIDWITTKCTNETGYGTIEVETLAGSQLASAKIAGKYSASFVRMDLGMQWEPTDFFSLGAVYENFNGAKVDLQGVSVVYVKHRLDKEAHVPTQEGTTYWNPFLTEEAHETEVEETIRNTLTMQPIELPRKLKVGMALKKPFLIAAEWEQWQNEYKFSSNPGDPATAHYITLKNITFLKLGMESQVMFLPMVIRGSLTGLLRPTTDDPDTEENLDEIFANLPVVPVDGNIYLGFGVLDGEFGLGVGGGGLPLIKTLMLDMTDIAKVFYGNVYYTKGNWQVSYLMTMDPVLTGFQSDFDTKHWEDFDIKLMQTSTLSIGFKF